MNNRGRKLRTRFETNVCGCESEAHGCPGMADAYLDRPSGPATAVASSLADSFSYLVAAITLYQHKQTFESGELRFAFVERHSRCCSLALVFHNDASFWSPGCPQQSATCRYNLIFELLTKENGVFTTAKTPPSPPACMLFLCLGFVSSSLSQRHSRQIVT